MNRYIHAISKNAEYVYRVLEEIPGSEFRRRMESGNRGSFHMKAVMPIWFDDNTVYDAAPVCVKALKQMRKDKAKELLGNNYTNGTTLSVAPILQSLMYTEDKYEDIDNPKWQKIPDARIDPTDVFEDDPRWLSIVDITEEELTKMVMIDIL